MTGNRKILLASDFIKHSETTLDAAVSVAKELKAELVLIHVIHDFDDVSFKNLMQTKLDEWSKKAELKNAVVSKSILKAGNIKKAVLETAKEEECGLIVIGCGSDENMKKGKIGSFAKGIIHESDRPVLLIKNMSTPIFGNILCAVDILETSRPALTWSIEMAHLCDSELIVLHALPEDGFSNQNNDNIGKELEAEKHLDEFLAKSDFKGVKWRKVFLNSMDPEGINDFANKNDVSVVILGESNSPKIEQFLFGSMPEKVMNMTLKPFMLIK